MKSTIKFFVFASAVALVLASCGDGKGSSKSGGDVYVPFKAQSGDRYGMISTDGKVLFKDEFVNEPDVSFGGVFSVKGNDGKLKYYTAEAKPQPVGKDAYTQGGYCDGSVIPVVKEGGPVFLIDKTGKEVASLAKAGSKQVKAVGKYFSDGLLLFFNEDGKFGYFNAKGEVAIEAQFTLAMPFHEGVALVTKSKEGETPTYFAIDVTGKEVPGLKIDDNKLKSLFCYDGVLVAGNKAYGKDGKMLFRVPSEWEFLSAYNGGYASFYKGGKCGVCDKEGKEVIRAKYDCVVRINGGFLAVDEVSDSYDVAFIDENDDEKAGIDGVSSFRVMSPDRILIGDGDEYYLVDAFGKQVGDAVYDYVGFPGEMETAILVNGHSPFAVELMDYLYSEVPAPEDKARQTSEEPNEINFRDILGSFWHDGTVPADFDVDGMVEQFKQACSDGNYEYTADGFSEFANEYFEHN